MDKQLQTTGARHPERVEQRPFVTPAVDIYENAEEVLLFADVPGVKKEQLKIDVDDGELTLWASRNQEAAGARLAQEYREVDFRRSFLLPDGIDTGRIEAELSAGVLRVRLPKSEARKPRRIEVRGG